MNKEKKSNYPWPWAFEEVCCYVAESEWTLSCAIF